MPDVTTLLISVIGAFCTLTSGLVGYIAQRERKIVANQFKGLVALVKVNNIKMDLVINSISQINGESNIGAKFQAKYDWLYDQKETTIKEYERQSVLTGMDV